MNVEDAKSVDKSFKYKNTFSYGSRRVYDVLRRRWNTVVAKQQGELPEKEREDLRKLTTGIFAEKMKKHKIQ